MTFIFITLGLDFEFLNIPLVIETLVSVYT